MTEMLIAVCGIACAQCHLWRASHGDVESAEHLARWWRSEGWMDEGEGAAEILAHAPHCLGCRGDRAKHWSPSCWILQCCVDEKGLEFCSECEEFPCERLVQWAAQNDRYTAALNRLREMRGGVA